MAPRKKAKRGKAKELAFAPSPNGFPALPLDILFEIFSLLHSLDLLHLARTTKPFRRFLLNRANVGIWRAAFSVLREEGFPECPPYSPEPAWTRLVFEKSCHVGRLPVVVLRGHLLAEKYLGLFSDFAGQSKLGRGMVGVQRALLRGLCHL
ncbi:hypothetical protein DFH06DRAFT_42092 [Mycena polygramma]|nr:hypothetical protein DFH06DRAFT_42092 [Mycena polygramma]